MTSVSFILIDAAQAIEVIVKEQADQELGDDSIDYGTIVLGGVTITLTKYPDIYPNNPTLELAAGGKHYITGSPVVVYGKDIEGTIVGTDLTALKSWYVSTVQSVPAVSSYFPTTPPTFTGFYKLVGGSPVLYYTVTMTLVQVL